MDVCEALRSTTMMRRLRPDPLRLDTQARILNAGVRAPPGGNTEQCHFGGVVTMALRRVPDRGNARRRGVAANRHPAHEVSSRHDWDAPFGIEIPQPLWPAA
ncbi:nitroreductase family protein [Mycobacterium camsae]|uniref:hypothetical protein n=1 Tax=Mycobacterium gordonae TaxID=1778 RepID=UPI001980200A|nr:hypothetical protein [Mycobacterium gordonae]